MGRIKKSIELDPLLVKDLKKLKLDHKQKEKIINDIKMIEEGNKVPKQLLKTMFPMKELKYLKWKVRVLFAETPKAFIFLSAARKKDWETKAYQDAKERILKYK